MPDTRTIDYSKAGYRVLFVYEENARQRERTAALNKKIKQIIKE